MEGASIELIIANASSTPAQFRPSKLSTFGYRALRLVDKKLMPMGTNPFRKVPLQVNNIPVISVKPIQTRYSDRFPEDAIASIREYNLDMLIRFGFRILRGDVLTVARYGILSLHHGDTGTYRGGPPAFWEVVNREPVTMVTAQLLTEDLDGGKVLGKAVLRTDPNSFYRNQVKLYWAGIELLQHTVQKAIQHPQQLITPNATGETFTDFYVSPLYRNPGNWAAFKISWQWMWYNTSRKFRELFIMKQWKLMYAFGKQTEASLFRYKVLQPPLDRIWADPFVVQNGNEYVLFFEEKLNKLANAHISCLRFDKNAKPITTVAEKVLTEPFHLSYPQVFSRNGEWYMIPETAATKELKLYRAIEFPHRWQQEKVLMQGVQIYDGTLYRHDGMDYLFCNAKAGASYSSDVYLHIYYSPDILKVPLQPHPMNPIYRDVRKSRPAGNLFVQDGQLIRPAQVCAPTYGYQVHFHRITELSATQFKEEPLNKLSPDWHPSITGMHTFNKADQFCVVDIQADQFRWMK